MGIRKSTADYVWSTHINMELVYADKSRNPENYDNTNKSLRNFRNSAIQWKSCIPSEPVGRTGSYGTPFVFICAAM